MKQSKGKKQSVAKPLKGRRRVWEIGAALLLLAVEAIIALPVAWDLLWAGALKG